MITKTTNLSDAYTKLFDEIRQKSNGAIDINSVEGFFGNIIEISALVVNEEGLTGKKYLRLPLDEPMFEIDANTRKIDVPAEFKSNGLSVQGDHLAETVYFVIDRYFDYMDFNNTSVSINWKMGSETGKTQNFTMITDAVPGCIVFGWPIDNIVTQKSGSLSFAVEFSIKDENNVLYDFNTLPATISIKDGLVVEDVQPTVLDDAILAALTDSKFGEGDAAVGDVIWLTGNGHGLVRNLANEGFIPDEFNSIVNLNTVVTNGVPSSSPIKLYAQGFVDASSDVIYFDASGIDKKVYIKVVKSYIPAESRDEDVTYYLEDGTVATEEDINNEEVELFILAPLSEDLKYFVKINDNPIAYRFASEEQLAAWGTENEVDLYMPVAELVVSEAGPQTIRAQGQKLDAEGHKIGAGTAIISDVVTVPEVQAPSKINITVAPPLEERTFPEGYSFAEDISNVIFLGTNEDTLTASAVVDNFGALQFVWKKKVGDNFEDISEEIVPYKTVNEDVFNVEEAGTYVVDVKNFLNGSAIDKPVSSAEIIASPLAGPITSATLKYKPVNGETEFISIPANGIISFNSGEYTNIKQLQLMIDDVTVDGEQGELEYLWYQRIDDELIEKWNGQIFAVPAGDAYYIPVVRNKLHGSIYTYQLDEIFADDR